MHWTVRNGEKIAKRGFKTLDEALYFKAHFSGGKDLQPYVCDVCGNWHLGHSNHK